MKRLLLFVILLCSPAFGSIAFVSASATTHAYTTACGTSASACAATTLTASTTAGNTVLVAVAIKTTGRTLAITASSSSAIFQQVTPKQANGTGSAIAWFACRNCPALTTVTPHAGGGTTLNDIAVVEYSGVGTVGIFNSATATSAAPGTSLTTGDSNNWVVVAESNLGNAGIPTAGTGNFRLGTRTGTTSSHVAIGVCDSGNVASSGSSGGCTTTISSGAWAAVAVELRSQDPVSNIYPNCGSAPCVIQHVATWSFGPAGIDSISTVNLKYQPTGANNLLKLTAITPSAKTVSTITDDGSGGANTWSSGPSTTNATDAHTTAVFYVCGSHSITKADVGLAAALVSGDWAQFTLDEVANVATTSCTDGTATSANGLTTSPFQPGAITTTASNSILFQDATTSYNFPESNTPLVQIIPDDSQIVLNRNFTDNFASSFQIVPSASSVNPSMYVVDPDALRWSTVAIAFKYAASTGTIPSGIRVVRITHFFNPAGTNYISGDTTSGKPIIPLPTNGNASVIASTQALTTGTFGTPADTGGNTYTLVTRDSTQNGQVYYSCSTSSTPGGLFGLSITSTAEHFVAFDIAGGATGGGTPSTACYDTYQDVDSPTQTLAKDPFTGAIQITPNTSNGLVISTITFGTGPTSAASLGTLASFHGTPTMDDTDNYDSGDGYWFYYNPNTSAISVDLTMTNSTPSYASSVTVALKAPAAPSGSVVPRHHAVFIRP